MKGGDTILKKKQLFMALIVVLFVAGTVGVPAASAKTTTNNTTNTTDNTRPGWGFGDKNHHHIGPPGHSVRPGDGDNDGENNDDQGENHGNHFSSQNFKSFIAQLQQAF